MEFFLIPKRSLSLKPRKIFDLNFDWCQIANRSNNYMTHIIAPFIPHLLQDTNIMTGCPYAPVN